MIKKAVVNFDTNPESISSLPTQLQTGYILQNARHKKGLQLRNPLIFGGVLGIRTLDLWIKSPLLYQLS